MACSKYTLTNTGSTLVNFNYRRCDDSLWEYQVELNPNQTKNIWLIDNTYSIASSFSNSVVLVNLGVFPAVSATPTQTPTQSTTPTPTQTQTQTPTNTSTPTQTITNTPTNSETPTSTPTPTNTETSTPTVTPTNTETPTPTMTPTNTETPTMTPTNTETPTSTPTPTTTETPTNTPTTTETPTQTVTPTNTETPTNTPTPTVTPTQTRYGFTVYSGSTYDQACGQYNSTVTIYGDEAIFDENLAFFNTLVGPAIGNMAGYYNNSQIVVQLDSNGVETGGFSACVTLTPTPTTSQTPTVTPTNTTTPTATFGYYSYTLGTGATANEACNNFNLAPTTVYAPVSGGIGPNVGETLYQTPGNPPTDEVPNGYYSNGNAWYIVSGGAGEITSADPNGCNGLITPTPTDTPNPTATPTPTSFGTNNFKVTMTNSLTSLTNQYVLTEAPYIITPGEGFTGNTGTFPLSATTEGSTTVTGLFDGVSFENVTFEVNATSGGSLSITVYVSGSLVYAPAPFNLVSGSNTVDLYIGNTYPSSNTIEFRLE